jgi:hypothetical protein
MPVSGLRGWRRLLVWSGGQIEHHDDKGNRILPRWAQAHSQSPGGAVLTSESQGVLSPQRKPCNLLWLEAKALHDSVLLLPIPDRW